MKTLISTVIFAITLTAMSVPTQAAPPGYSLCKHYDGTIALFEGYLCPAGWTKQY